MKRMPWVALLLVSQAAFATTMVRQDVPVLSREADAVVRGTVARMESRWSGDRRVIFTEIRIDVAETLKGEAPRTAIVRQRGGVVGDIGQRVDGLASFREGEEVVLFLDRKPDGSFIVEGMAQGKFRVERSSDGRAAFAVPERIEAEVVDPATGAAVEVPTTPMTLDELRLAIRQALQEQGPSPGGTLPAPVSPVQKPVRATEGK